MCAVGFVCAIVAELTATAMTVGMIVAAVIAIIALLVIKKNAEKKAAVN